MLHIALLRSIVLGARRVKSADAIRLVEAVGGTDVAAAGGTGNLVLRSRKGPQRLEREIEAQLAGFFGRSTEVVVKTAAQWRALMAANPFKAQPERAPARLLVWVMRSPLPDAGLARLRARAQGDERIERTASGDLHVVWRGRDQRLQTPLGLRPRGLGRRGYEPQLEHGEEDHSAARYAGAGSKIPFRWRPNKKSPFPKIIFRTDQV